jgi:hypothetical protein
VDVGLLDDLEVALGMGDTLLALALLEDER